MTITALLVGPIEQLERGPFVIDAGRAPVAAVADHPATVVDYSAVAIAQHMDAAIIVTIENTPTRIEVV